MKSHDDSAAGGEPAHRAHMRLHHRRMVRWVFLALGCLFVVVGVVGIFVPLLPTTPFMLAAAACFARGSERFYVWLFHHRTFGPMVREWQAHRSIPWRTKLYAIALMAGTMGVSIVFFVRPLALQLGVAACGVLLALGMYRIPSRDRPGRSIEQES